jgi:hypothetical protein
LVSNALTVGVRAAASNDVCRKRRRFMGFMGTGVDRDADRMAGTAASVFNKIARGGKPIVRNVGH